MAIPVMNKPATTKSSLKAPSKNWLTLSATESPTEFKQTGLPAGLSLAAATGLITGSPTAAVGKYTVKISAKNASGTSTEVSFEWEITAEVKITSPGNQVSKERVAITPLALAAAGTTPLTWKAVSLPLGLSISASTGEITGTPTTPEAKHTVKLEVKSVDGGEASITIEWTVEVSAPGVTNPGEQVSITGVAITPVQIETQGPATTFVVEKLPLGLSMSASGLITGTPSQVISESKTVVVKVTGTGGTTTINFEWKIMFGILPTPDTIIEYGHIGVFT